MSTARKQIIPVPILEVRNAVRETVKSAPRSKRKNVPLPVIETTKTERVGFAALFLDNRYHLEPATDGQVEIWDTQTGTVIKTASNMARAQMFVASMEQGT